MKIIFYTQIIIFIIIVIHALNHSSQSSDSKTKKQNQKITNTSTGNLSTKKDSFSTEQYNTDLPDLICVLFDKLGCNTTCFLIGSLYNQIGRGVCELNQCDCKFRRNPISYKTTLSDLWNEKFHRTPISAKLLKNFLNLPNLVSQILSILKDPVLTETECQKQLIEKFLGIEEFRQLKPQKNYAIHTFLNDDGNVLFPELESYFTFQLQLLFDQLVGHLRNSEYEFCLLDFFKNNTNVRIRYHIMRQLVRTKNATLIDIVFENFPQTPLVNFNPSVTVEEIKLIPEIAMNIVINEFINYIDMMEEC